MLLGKRSVALLFLFATHFILSLFNAGSAVHAQSVGGTTSGAVTYCTSTNSGIVTVSGYTGNILNWQSTTDGGGIWNSNVNTTPNQTYFNLNQTTCYRAIVQDGAFPPDTSTVVCITIYPESVGGTVSGGGSFCDSTGSGMLTLAGYSGSILNWLSSTDGGVSWSFISNITTTHNYSNLTQSTLYAAVVQSNPACPADTSLPATFTVSPPTEPGIINGGTAVCETANSGTLTLIGYTGAITGWESSTDNGISWAPIANTTDTLGYQNLNQSILYRVIVQSGTCAADTTADASMTVSAATVAGTISGGAAYCGTTATGILTLSGFTGSILNWLESTDNGATWNTVANTSNAESYVNLTETTWYSAVVQSGVCDIDTSTVEIVSVAPQTVAGTINSSATACAFVNEDTLVLSGNIGSVIGWLFSTNNGTTWTSISNTSASHVYSGLTQTTLYAAIVQSGACNIDTTAAVTITVVSLPSVNAGSDVTITQGESVTLNATGTGTPIWMPSAGLSTATAFTPVASPSATTTYILIVTGSNSCINADTVMVTVLQNVFDGKISNLFTPNGDGLNDVWYIEGIQNYPENEVFVYNIYGAEVFRAEAYMNDWKGTYNGAELPDGTYYYVVVFKDTDTTLRGSVDILRSR